MSVKRILVIDDEESILLLVRLSLIAVFNRPPAKVKNKEFLRL
jgi:hypothetical protein